MTTATITPATATWDKVSGEQAVRVGADLRWAIYDAAGNRTHTGTGSSCAPTVDQLADWDAEAPVRVPALLAATATAAAERRAANAGIAARYPGTCKVSGQRYGKGARIEQTCYGWALVGATLDLTYQMDREDSMF